jgi:uncharacterized protein with PIN domain
VICPSCGRELSLANGDRVAVETIVDPLTGAWYDEIFACVYCRPELWAAGSGWSPVVQTTDES